MLVFVFVFAFDFLCLMLIECSGVARRQTSVGAERVWRRGGDLCAQVLFVTVVVVLFFLVFLCGGYLCAQVLFVSVVFVLFFVWGRSMCPGVFLLLFFLAGILNQVVHCAHKTNILIASISTQN